MADLAPVCPSCAMLRGKVGEYARIANARSALGQHTTGYADRIQALKDRIADCAANDHRDSADKQRSGGLAARETRRGPDA